jgi:hypothetical protein
MKPPTVKTLRQRLEERRRRALGLVKAIDRVGLSPEQLDALLMRRFAEADGDCMAWLAHLAPMPSRAMAPPDWLEVNELEKQMDELEQMIFASLPSSYRRAVQEAHEVGMLVVDDDEIYEGIRRPRRR